MKITIFGSTGLAGSGVLHEALKANHEVTVLVRDKKRLQTSHQNLKVMQGDILNENDVNSALKGSDAVISTISEGLEIKKHIQSKGTEVIIKGMKKNGILRFICMGAIGILQFNEFELIRDQSFYPEEYKAVSYEHSEVNDQLNKSGLEWTQVCPPVIEPGESNGEYLVKSDYKASKNMKVLSGNLGLFIILEIKKREFLRKRVGISNK